MTYLLPYLARIVIKGVIEMKWLAGIIMLATVTAFSACATIDVSRVDDTKPNEGIIFYQPDLYLLVALEKDMVPKYTIITLPNKKRAYSIRAVPGLGAVKLTANLKDGWQLTSLNEDVDTKSTEMLAAVTGVLGAAAAFKEPAQEATAAPTIKPIIPTGMYRLVFDEGIDGKGHLLRLEKVELLSRP